MSEQEAPPRVPSDPLQWRVRVCRQLWRVLGFVWGTLIVGIVIGTLANLNTTTTGIQLANLFIVHLALTYPLPVWSSLGLLLTLTLLSWFGSRDKQTVPAFPLSARDRAHLLRRLHVRYEQILAQSLQGAVQVELELASRPAAVQNAISLSLRLPDQPEQLLPPHTSIVQAYELAQQELLILGEPGAGKSTLLVELAHCLVEQAEQDETRPLPILLPLSTWAVRRPPLDEWLSEELTRLYDIPPRLSQQYIQAEQVLPLLDGLDEMEETARPACIAAINTYHREHLRPLVVCSRTGEYEVATRHEHLALHTAVVVQPLERRQVEAYLASLGKPLAGLRAALKTNPLLQELATTPLMLQVLMLTYRGKSVRALSRQAAQVQEQVWTDYVERMVRDKGNAMHYPLPRTRAWLAFLAQQLQKHQQTIFSAEDMDAQWLAGPQQRTLTFLTSRIPSLLIGVCLSLLITVFIILTDNMVFLLQMGMIGGFVGACLSSAAEVEAAERGKPSQTKTARHLRNAVLLGVLLATSFGLYVGPHYQLSDWLRDGCIFGLGSLLSGWAFQVCVDRQAGQRAPLPSSRSRWRGRLLIWMHRIVPLPIWQAAALLGIGIGLSAGLRMGLSEGLYVGLSDRLGFGLYEGLGNGLSVFLPLVQ